MDDIYLQFTLTESIITLLVTCIELKRYLGDYSTKVPPLPIPNRAVKLRHADGTAYCGRVGSRRFTEPRGSSTSGLFFI